MFVIMSSKVECNWETVDTSLGGFKKFYLEQKFSKAQTAANLKGVIKSAAAAAKIGFCQHPSGSNMNSRWNWGQTGLRGLNQATRFWFWFWSTFFFVNKDDK